MSVSKLKTRTKPSSSSWPGTRLSVSRRSIFKSPKPTNTERRAFYELCWHLAGSQSDIASLSRENVDWKRRTIGYARGKTGSVAALRFSAEVEAILQSLPETGPFFPYLINVRASDRATEFKQRCGGLEISGVTLHSYRYAWAERAKVCGYPERFAQEALGHNSKAVHRAYAKRAEVTLPAIDDYERQHAGAKIMVLPDMDEQVNGTATVRMQGLENPG